MFDFKKIFTLFFCLCFAIKLFGSQTLVVELDSEDLLARIEISPIAAKNCPFKKSYLTSLEEVLAADLKLSGYFEPVYNEKTSYAIALVVDDRLLEATFDLKESRQKAKFPKLSLTGNLSEDRRAMHQIANGILKIAFNVSGIAETKVLYAVRTKNGTDSKLWTSEIFESDYDGANARPVTNQAGYCISPVYIPPKKGCEPSGYFYVSYQNGQPKIYYSGLKEMRGRRLTPLKGNQLMPAISSQKDNIAFISDAAGNPDLFLQPFSTESGPVGKPRQIYTTRQATQGSPSFSPDGKKIAFVSNKDGSARVYVIDIPKENTSLKNIHAKLISKRTKESTSPAWSPDGKKIAYSSNIDGIRQIVVYDFETDVESVLTDGPMHKENPSFASNSFHILFNAIDEDSSELYLVNLRQKCSVKVSVGSGDKRFPCFGPTVL